MIFWGANFQLLVKQKLEKNWKFSFFRVKLTNFFLKINIDLVENLANFQNN